MSDTAADLAALRDFLVNRDVACPCCRYNLRGIADVRCPECGEYLRLCVATSAGPKSPAFSWTAWALGAALLLDGLAVLYVVVRSGGETVNLVFDSLYELVRTGSLARWWRHPGAPFLLAGVHVLGSVTALAFLFRLRNGFRRLPPGLRRTAIASAVAWAALLLLVLARLLGTE